MSTRDSNEKRSPLSVPHVWAFTTYFAEGLPYTIIRMVSSVFFRDMRVSLEAIGLTSLFGIPWVIKFLWGPLIDEFGTKRKWMLIMQFLLVLLFLVVAFVSPLPLGVAIIGGLLFSAHSCQLPTILPSTATTWRRLTKRHRPNSWATGSWRIAWP
jgi:MFS family permease